MAGSWAAGWAVNDIVTAAEFKKGVGMIADSTLGASAAQVDLAGLPTTYAHLLIAFAGRGDVAAGTANMRIRFNNDTTAKYDYQYVEGATATASAASAATQTSGLSGDIAGSSATAGLFGGGLIFLPGYSSTAITIKPYLVLSGVNTDVLSISGVYNSGAAAISRITLFASSGNLVASTRVTVYALGA